jgi:catechol O-methyltransferase
MWARSHDPDRKHRIVTPTIEAIAEYGVAPNPPPDLAPADVPLGSCQGGGSRNVSERLADVRGGRHRAGMGDRMRKVTEIGGKRLPFLRWSFLRLLVGLPRLLKTWQVGDGREEALGRYVVEHARAGDVVDAIRAVDEFCYQQSFMINVGDEKGALLDAAIERCKPRQLLELGTYCGYSALRTARVMPDDGHLYSVEFLPANAEIARRVLAHAGVPDRVTVVVGSLGDGGRTAELLEGEHGFGAGTLDFVFLDHDKDAYLPDLQLIESRGWLHPGSVVVADNVKFPGAPKYRAYLQAQEGRTWRTVEHRTHAEYQTMIKDVVLESDYLGPPAS